MDIILVNDKKSQEIQQNLNISLEKLVHVFKSEKNISRKKVKVSNQDASDLVDELLAEELEETKNEFKNQAKNLIKEKIEFDKFIDEKRNEFQKAVNQKSEEFIKKCESLFKMIENMNDLKEDYSKILTANKEL